MDTALVLVGPQGIGKSTLGHILAYGEWFSDALPPVHSKDASDHLRGLWLIEFGEMAAARRAEIEDFKAFMTRTEERFRPAYGRFEISYPRRNVFFGTSNKDAFLRDETGNRRFWPVTVTSLDIARLEADRDQLWAEAVHAFDAGERWHLVDDESRLALVQQNAFTVVDERAEELSRKLMGRQKTTALECLDLLGFQQRGKAQQKEVTDMLKSLGWHRQTNGRSRYWVAPLTTSGSRGWSAGGLNDVDFG
jgi:predicted P-loop ATPase